MIVLVDMDGVTADFERGFFDKWKSKHPNEVMIPYEERSTHKITHQYPQNLKKSVKEIYQSPGFFLDLSVIPGSVEALQDMISHGINVFFCTSPLTEYQNCISEKFQWVEKHFGKEWTKRIIFTKDKTVIAGDYLIDDKPSITGINQPSWQHIIFDQPWNRNTNHNAYRCYGWEDWKTVLLKNTE